MLFETIQADIIAAMKAKDEHTVSTLRMAKAAIQSKEKDKHAPLGDGEIEAILSMLIKQRKDSAEQFAKGGAADRADRELIEISMLEKYLPREVTETELRQVTHRILAEAASANTPHTMGSAIAAVKAHLASIRLRADGKMLSIIVKQML